MFKPSTRTRGFTLIELLVVIAIIGLLSSVVIASLNTARQKSRDARRVADVRQMQLALEMFFDKCSRYPATTGTALPGTGANNGCPTGTTLGSFIANIPVDPVSTQSYGYATDTNGTTYVIRADLEATSHSSLASDVDGTNVVASGFDCADTNGLYCMRP